MKILQITGMNLNSLYGKWTIDLQHPEYESNGIFALTGPTGGGKTTILDAITLALFGQTVRLGRITKSSNEIMSRGTGECLAEIVFSCSKGIYRCTWYQHRARKKPEGNLAEAIHEISDYTTGVIIETKKAKVKEVIIEKTGMDFTQFTRSILLAQGAFDTFLKATEEEKSRILEQITGTEIYSTIGRRVFERKKQEEDRLQQLRGEVSRFSTLSDEELQQVQEAIGEKALAIHEREKNTGILDDLLSWTDMIRTLTQELQEHQKRKEEIQQEHEDFAPDLKRLTLARLAAGLQSRYDSLLSLRERLLTAQKAHSGTIQTVDELERSTAGLQDRLEQEKEQLGLVTASLEEEREKAKTVYALDQSISTQEGALSKARTTLLSMRSSLRETAHRFISALRDKEQCEKKVHSTQDYLNQHRADENLDRDIESLRYRISTIQNLTHEIEEVGQTLGSAEATLRSLRKEEEALQINVAELKGAIEKERQSITSDELTLSELLQGRLLREMVQEKDHLLSTRALQQQIVDLETYRRELSDDQPCPLCGSLSHPYAAGNLPKVSETDRKIREITSRITQSETLQEAIARKEKALQTLQQTLSSYDKDLAVLTNSLETHIGQHEKTDALMKKKMKAREVEQASLQEITTPYAVTYESVDQLLASLEERLSVWKESSKALHELANELTRLDGEVLHFEQVREEKKHENRKHVHAIREQEEELRILISSRRALYGTKDPDKELEDRTVRVKDLEKMTRITQEELQNQKETLRAQVTERDLLEKEITRVFGQVETSNQEFATALTERGFADSSEFLAALLDPEHLEALEHRNDELRSAKEKNITLIEEVRSKLDREKEKSLTTESAEELREKRTALSEELSSLREDVATLRAKLRADEEARQLIKGKEREIASQELVLSRWTILSELIGSADGRKYRSFAQGLTFEIMIGYANEQLMKMSDRYLLMRDEEIPLEVNVMDAYQGSEVRSVKNVSGGESFIISLSLALGLSRMASRNVRVDSLFLDEGFGTLDEKSLETALQTLSTLPQEGKIIGLISHVHGLKERIGTYITVTAHSGGKSLLSGPGISYQ
ncbi:MAG: AAA family ATPase [Sphaerochaetaceae bacterium]|nr:AAA family ATPase [Sphaerochaetaceae bacterium]